MLITCAYCGCRSNKLNGHVKRAQKLGMRVFCNARCSGLSRRSAKTKNQKRQEKAEYDRQYRSRNADKLKRDKAEQHKCTYDPIAAAQHRKTRMKAHVEYCRRPEYKKWKSGYDQRRRANKSFGPFADAFITLLEVEREIKSRATDYEIRLANGTLNKAQSRRRQNGRSDRR